MIEELGDLIQQLLGLGSEDISYSQMALRALVAYIAALAMIRVGEKRFLGKSTAFDVILGIILGSVVSRGINGSAPFFPTLVAGFVLVVLHWLIAAISFRSDWFGNVVKGSHRLLVNDGEILWNEMQSSHISRKDLMTQIRLKTNQERLENVKKAYLERSGDVSVVECRSEPQVVEVDVAEGVHTIRIEIQG